MDALIAERFGMKVNINGTDCIVVESDFLAELGPVEGNGKKRSGVFRQRYPAPGRQGGTAGQ
ncbi:ATP-binding protein [Salmonella sp. NCTC 11881]|nr:ATP-binding protein [Salmonella sp. NCTC 11881]